MRYRGVVKWFNNTKGYGFILSDDFSEELFVHYSYVDMDGYKTLKADQVVTFETQQTPTGYHAKAVQVASEAREANESLASPADVHNLSASSSEEQADQIGNTYKEQATDPMMPA